MTDEELYRKYFDFLDLRVRNQLAKNWITAFIEDVCGTTVTPGSALENRIWNHHSQYLRSKSRGGAESIKGFVEAVEEELEDARIKLTPVVED